MKTHWAKGSPYFTDKEINSQESPQSVLALTGMEGQSQDLITKLNDSCELRTSRSNRGVPHKSEENTKKVEENQEMQQWQFQTEIPQKEGAKPTRKSSGTTFFACAATSTR